MPRVTQAEIDGKRSLFRADSLNLDAQLWERRSDGEYFIYIPSTERLYPFSHEGERDIHDVLKSVHDRLLMIDIINALPILPAQKQALRNRLHRGNLGQEMSLPK